MLRPWAPTDIDFVYSSCQDVEIQRWTKVPRPYEREHAQDFVNEVALRSWSSGEGALFAVVDTTTFEVVGSMSVVRFTEGVAEIGYWTAQQFRGQGWSTAALRRLRSWCITERHSERMELEIEETNAASRQVAVKAGFVQAEIIRTRCVLQGRPVNMVLYNSFP